MICPICYGTNAVLDSRGSETIYRCKQDGAIMYSVETPSLFKEGVEKMFQQLSRIQELEERIAKLERENESIRKSVNNLWKDKRELRK